MVVALDLEKCNFLYIILLIKHMKIHQFLEYQYKQASNKYETTTK